MSTFSTSSQHRKSRAYRTGWMVHKCQCCGKSLSDPISVSLRMGPVCRIRLKVRESSDTSGHLFSDRSDYSFTLVDGVICIIDNDGGRSVTNDAHNIIDDFTKNNVNLGSTPIIYRDTQGVWDQLVVKDGRFETFKSINERNMHLAIQKVKASLPH